MKNKKKEYFKSLLFLLFAIFLLFFIIFVQIHIALTCPNITYQGNRSVLKEDVINLGSIKIRDLKIDKCRDVMPGMLNIGYRPTFGGNRMSIEVNIFDYEGDLYGKLLTVEFHHRIRDERKFDSIEQLVEQLIIDRKEIEKR